MLSKIQDSGQIKKLIDIFWKVVSIFLQMYALAVGLALDISVSSEQLLCCSFTNRL